MITISPQVTSITGTSNQVTASSPNGAVTLSLPQDIATGSSPQFAGVNVGHASDTTITRSGAGDIAVEGNAIYRAGGTDVALADGGTGASLTDPNADRILFWDDSAGSNTWLTPNTGLTISGTNLNVTGITAAEITNRTRSIFVPVASFYATAGTPGPFTETTDNVRAGFFDAAATETMLSDFVQLPSDFDSGNLTIKSYWAMETATSGNVVISADYFISAAGGTTAGITAIGNTTESVPASTDLLKVTTHSSAISGYASGSLIKLRFSRIGGNASDTASGDLRLFGMGIEYTADM